MEQTEENRARLGALEPDKHGHFHLSDTPLRALGAVARKMGATTTGLSTVRQRLLDRGPTYATEDYGYVDFTVPRFAEFMRRSMPTFRPASSR